MPNRAIDSSRRSISADRSLINLAILFCLAAASISAANAQATAAPAPTQAGVAGAMVVKPNEPPPVYLLPGTDISFQFSKDFRIEDPTTVSHKAYRSVMGSPEDRAAGGCYPVLIALGAGDFGDHFQDARAEHFVPDPPTGGIVLQEIMPRCLDETRSEDDRLALLVAGPRSMGGYNPIAGIIRSKMGEATTMFSAVQAYSKDTDGIRRASSGITLIASLSMRYKGRIFLGSFTANDPGVLSQVTSVTVQFGSGEPSLLVPFRLGLDDHKGNKNALPR
jgi:hypothetical protein